MELVTPQKIKLQVVQSLYDWHTKLFHNALVDITDTDAVNRLNTKANHIAWLTGSLVYGRYSLANILGIDQKQQSYQLFENFKGIIDDAAYPPLEEFKNDWNKISPLLKDKIDNLSEDELNGPDPFKMPGGDFTLFDTLLFCTDRESYCLGQIGIFRRLLNYPALKFD